MVPSEIRVWNEDENPLETVAGILRDRKVTGPVGIEETVRYFAIDGLMRVMPDVADHERRRRGARLPHDQDRPPKSRCMQKAADITIAAYRYVAPRIERGMTPGRHRRVDEDARTKRWAPITNSRSSCSAKPAPIRMARASRRRCAMAKWCSWTAAAASRATNPTSRAPSCSVKPMPSSARCGSRCARDSSIAIETARVGVPAGAVDDAVRAQYEKWGYGPGYKLPGTSHRTGHGIGLDGHEPVNLVHGEATPLAPGMCFSNEPGIYLPGKFGIRLEDCFHMGEKEPVWFSKPPDSLDKPFG